MPGGSTTQCGLTSYLQSRSGRRRVPPTWRSCSTTIGPVGLLRTYTVSGVGAGTFYIRVRSQGSGGLLDLSNEVVVTVTGVTAAGRRHLGRARGERRGLDRERMKIVV